MKTKKRSIQIKEINGYKVLFVYTPSNTIHVEAVVHSGFVHETKETSGINHLLEHVIVHGWRKCKQSCNTYWDEHGGLVNASTDNTVMKYYVKGDPTDMKDMIEYISTITTRCLFHETTLKNEKDAVIDELTALTSNPETSLYDIFNKAFFKIDGLKYVEDCKLQIKNLKHLTMDHLKKAYEKFNTEHLLFIVYGDYSISKACSYFSQYLKKHQGEKIQTIDCFSKRHDILYTHREMDGTHLVLGFPSMIKTATHLDCFSTLLHQLLFKELRTKRHLLYDVEVNCNTTRCGSFITIGINAITSNIIESFNELLSCLRNYQELILPKEQIDSIKKKVIYNYNTNYNFVDYYGLFIYESSMPLTKSQLIKKAETFCANDFKRMCKELILIENALCVYQGNKKINISW
jgi:predicted Zn-dependent peptidase